MGCVLALTVSAELSLAQSPAQARFFARAFGGMQQRLPTLAVPSRFAKYIPKDAVLRFSAATHMSASGETVLAYENGIDPNTPFSNAHLLMIRNDRIVTRFDFTDDVSGIAGVVAFPFRNGREAVAWACRLGADGAGIEFQVFGERKGAYVRIFRKVADRGRMEIWEGKPLHIDLWSATHSLDDSNLNLSCVWCLHFYKIERYRWAGDGFKLVGERSTHKALSPEQVTDTAFVIHSPRAAARK